MKRVSVSLQTKILVLIITLIVFITILLTTIIAYLESEETEQHIGERALHVATTLSLMPTIRDAFALDEPETVIQPVASEVREMIGAEFIVVGNSESIRYAHPDEEKVGREMVGGDNDKALIHGEYYTSKATGSLGPSLRGKAPVINDDGEIVGIISVGFMVEDIRTTIFNKLLKISGVAILVIAIGIIGGILLARSIRKDTYGLEPHQIASLYRDRNAILESIKEGVIAIDKDGQINMMNESAQKILGLSENNINKKIEDVFPNTRMYNVLFSGDVIKNDEMILNNRNVIINRTPIMENEEVIGVVSSFRDKTELNEMINTLSEVRKYSEDLRAQTHEYTNKLYVISGLLQLGYYKKAIELIQTESQLTGNQNKILIEQINDRTVQAILLGKIGKASEMKINFEIESSSYLGHLPEHLDIVKLITILGNLLDNAIEAVETNEYKNVVFFATDLGGDIVFEIADNGVGISDDKVKQIFEQGFSTKDNENRGYGLAIVKETVNELQGQIEVTNQPTGGAVFTVFIPKEGYVD
ncbi:CitB family two-component system sensor histidine kinase CitS [Virgibacillus natechei]|uniref:histidine kinase n=1 Tax=Virgibacillus natechei TaxID=1216297 RepID=A0ABS4IIE4_9BACI|nr:sensor histidine kinase [Virgibacillus natechei]MBP1970729.1 CitB family two-component system sensor histidine kinase CitS [Virgibacillus natechei]UZD12031.1 sensor histidine kinase [Virgibacillus natechei]